ncbi:MAG: hypothetical protein WD751_09680 [Anaerolineales bacterium]
MKSPFIFIAALLLLNACAAPKQPPAAAPLDVEPADTQAPAVTAAPTATELPAATAEPSPTPFPMENGVFTGQPDDFLLTEEELAGQYAAADDGSASTNMDLLQARADGDAYIAATGRLTGWRIQFNREAEGESPPYIVNVVNIYQTAEGAQLVLSREWHQDVWAAIDSGQLTRLPEIAGLDAEQLVWQTADGAVGVEIVYRNLYIFLTGPAEGDVDQYQFFADLIAAHLDWIKEGES